MEEFVNLIVNNGVAIAMVVYFAWRDVKYMQKLDSTLDVIVAYMKKEGKE